MNETSYESYQNPKGYEIDFDLLKEFELGLDPIQPTNSTIPCHTLGYGEISTVFELLVDKMSGLAFKRMSIFNTQEELRDYLSTYIEYCRLLENEVGLHLPSHGHAAFLNKDNRPIFYIIQEKVASPSIGNKALHLLPRTEVLDLFRLVLKELIKVWQFNQRIPNIDVGIDGQVSNWVINNFTPEDPHVDQDTQLAYVDTSSPLVRIEGREQMDTELFLRAAPSFLAWILRILFVKDVVGRYYDFRLVAIDLLANCCKEQRPGLIPDLVVLVNDFFVDEVAWLDIKPIEEKEIFSYYKEDALIWSLYLSMRRVDRFLHKYVLFKPYHYILPGSVKR